jgi:phosphoserine phosphatase
MSKTLRFLIGLGIIISACQPKPHSVNSNQESSLDLWNDGNVKSNIISFVTDVTNVNSVHYLNDYDRIAVFDMDGTILLEKPNYVLFDFAVKKILEKISMDPELKEKQPFKAIYEKDWSYFSAKDIMAEDGLYSVLLYATDGLTNEQYYNGVKEYFDSVVDSRYGVSYNKLVYAPVVQLIDYLHENDFSVYIVSGSDPQFTRAFCEESTGIPVTNVLGTTVLTNWVENDTNSYFVRLHEFIKPINDKAGKPVNILNKIGKLPVFAIGNSTGDLQMLEYSKNAPLSLQLIVNHDDSVREYSYHVEEMSNLCEEKGWLEISMKNDFKTIFKESY